MSKKIDLYRLEKDILETVRKYYGGVQIKDVRIGRNKITVFGLADKNWFKVLVKGDGQVRVYSSSRTIENVLIKHLRGKRYE